MISFENFAKMFSVDLQNRMCIEIEFSVGENYQNCWMGKMPEQKKTKQIILPLFTPKTPSHDIYWFGLASDGTASYDYDNFADFSSAPVFDGKSLKEIWINIELLSIDGCDPEERIQFYI